MQLKQSTAFARMFYVGTPGLTLTMEISKAGAAFATPGGAITEVSDGWYKMSYTTGDTDTVGSLAWNPLTGGWPGTLGLPVDEVIAPVTISGIVIQ